jgi:hypothetical protein
MLEKAGQIAGDDVLTPEEAIQDPFVLEFLDLKDGRVRGSDDSETSFRKSPAGNTGCEANEALAISRIETNEHGAAILDVRGTKLHRQTKPRCCELDVYNAAVSGPAAASHQIALLQPIKCRRDGRVRSAQLPGDFPYIPVTWFGQHREQSYIVDVEIGIKASRQQARFELKPAHDLVHGLVHGQGVAVADGAGRGSLHHGHDNPTFGTLPPGGIAAAGGQRATLIDAERR